MTRKLRKKLSERQLIELMFEQYKSRLRLLINETDVYDEEGNILLTRDLKVRHKKSQYEYTVDDVFVDSMTGDVKIALRLPSEPRFEPPPDDPDILIKDRATKELLDEDDLLDVSTLTTDELRDPPDEMIFVIDQEEFEKEYEVK